MYFPWSEKSVKIEMFPAFKIKYALEMYILIITLLIIDHGDKRISIYSWLLWLILAVLWWCESPPNLYLYFRSFHSMRIKKASRGLLIEGIEKKGLPVEVSPIHPVLHCQVPDLCSHDISSYKCSLQYLLTHINTFFI